MVDAGAVGSLCTVDARDSGTTFRLWAALMEPTHLWGPSPPPDPGGVHVHCEGRSDVDDSFDSVLVQGPGGEVVVDADSARLCWLAEMLGRPTAAIDCPQCGRLHRDDRATVRQPPLARTCPSCGQVAQASELVVASPLAGAWERIGLPRPQPAGLATTQLALSAGDHSVIALWPTSTEILTNADDLEVGGVHVHAWDLAGEMVVDATFAVVEVDGAAIGTDSVRREAARVGLAR